MASTSPASVEWERANLVQISVDLVPAAKQELSFLAAVEGTPALKNRQVLEIAVARYLNCWLPLASILTRSHALQPPLDCAWVWHCHKLHPVQYAKDCQQLFGKIVDVRVPGPSRTVSEALATQIWTQTYPGVPYHFIRAGARVAEQQQLKSVSLPNKLTITFDLIAAIERQASFYYQVRRPWMYEDRYLEVALERYQGFLHLIKLARENEANGGPRPFLVPTYDIDLLWHTHQLFPTLYRIDTILHIGTVLDHDDSDSNREAGGKLRTSFADTCERWLAAYGTVYEHAGSSYRGSEPARAAPPTPSDLAELVICCPPGQVLPRRQTMQVNLVVFGAANVHPTLKASRKSCYFIRVSALRKCPDLKLTTAPVACSSVATEAEVTWNEGFSLQAELSTKGLRMELMTFTEMVPVLGGKKKLLDKLKWSSIPVFKKKPKCIGEIYIEWHRDLLNSTSGLSLTTWASLAQNFVKFPDCPPKLHFSVSVTPPTPAPHIFRMLPAPVTDDQGLEMAKLVPATRARQEGRWITRSVMDHSGEERFVVRTRWAKGVKRKETEPEKVSGAETVIQVHEGPMRKLTTDERRIYQKQSLVQAPFPHVSEANQLAVGQGLSMDEREWTLFDGAALLTVFKPVDGGGLNCELLATPGLTGYPIRLLSGRWLEYEVAGSREEDESKYLTLIRYTPDAPMGKATAIINWQTASIEVKPDENVVLVLLVAAAITASLLQMDYRPSNEVPPKRRRKQSSAAGHLGAIQLQRNGLSDQWRRRSTDRAAYYWEASVALLFYFLFWWELSGKEIRDAQNGAGCGGGACTAGSCGGGACSPAGGCEGVPFLVGGRRGGVGWDSGSGCGGCSG